MIMRYNLHNLDGHFYQQFTLLNFEQKLLKKIIRGRMEELSMKPFDDKYFESSFYADRGQVSFDIGWFNDSPAMKIYVSQTNETFLVHCDNIKDLTKTVMKWLNSRFGGEDCTDSSIEIVS